MATTSRRRAERERLIQRFIKRESERGGPRAVNHDEWLTKAARMYANTRCSCSCYICRSPRRKYGNGKASLTFQEIHANIKLREHE